MYNAVIRSKLLYGLECLELTEAEKAKLDSFQINGLRRILHIPPTHVDRATTNDMVLEKAAMVLEKLEPIKRFSESCQDQKFKLLGHILRADVNDPLHQVCFKGDQKTPKFVPKRRVGRPREHWLLNTMEEAYDHTTPENVNEQFDPFNETHINWLVQGAKERDDIYWTKPYNEKLNLFRTKNEDISEVCQDD